MTNGFLYLTETCSGGAEYVDCSDPKAQRRVDSTCSTRNMPNFDVSDMALEFSSVKGRNKTKMSMKNNQKVILFIVCYFDLLNVNTKCILGIFIYVL